MVIHPNKKLFILKIKKNMKDFTRTAILKDKFGNKIVKDTAPMGLLKHGFIKMVKLNYKNGGKTVKNTTPMGLPG